MSQEADWLQWHEDRWNLPPSQGGRQEYAPNGPPRGIVPFPLTDAEFDLLLKRFFLADDMLTDAQVNGHEVLDTEVAQTLRGKLMEWVEAYGQFPVFADTGAASNNYDEMVGPERYFKWYTVADIKSRMPYANAFDQLKDSGGNDLPDDFPVLILAPRKYGGFGGVVFYHDDWPDTDNWAIYYTKAQDFVADHPEYHDWLIENGGYVSDTDLLIQIHLTRQHFLNSQFVVNFILNTILQNINQLNLNVNIITIPFPSTPPGGTWPPGTSGPPSGTYVPPGPLPATDINLNCSDAQIELWTGTNHILLAALLGGEAIPTLPIPVFELSNFDFKADLDYAIQFYASIADLTTVEEVEVCIKFTYLASFDGKLDGINQALLSSKGISFEVHTGANANPPNQVYTLTVPPEELWSTGLFKTTLPTLPLTVEAKAVVARSTDQNTLIFNDYSNITQILMSCDLMPALFDPNNDIFNNTWNSPYLELGITRVRLKNATWRGVGHPVDVDSPCTVGNIAPGFLQDAASWDWKNASGDTANIFTGVDWSANIDAILIEAYSPPALQSLWMTPSGSGQQGVMDAWRNINPEAPYDGSNNLLVYQDTYATNQIQYTWLRVPAGQTNFAVDVAPNPFSGWVKIVAYHDSGSGTVTIQDSAHKCGSLTYPAYPAYPF